MSIKYKLFLSFFLMTSLFLVGVVSRFFELHRTRKLVDSMQITNKPPEDPHERFVTKARELVRKVPPVKGDPRLAATVLALDLVTGLRQCGEHAVAMAGASLMEKKGVHADAVRGDLKRLIALADILGARSAEELVAMPEVKTRLEGEFARVRVDPEALVKVLQGVPPEIRAAAGDLTLLQLAEAVLENEGVLARSSGALGKAGQAFLNFQREVTSVTAELRKAEARLTARVIEGLQTGGAGDLVALRELLEDEHAGLLAAAVAKPAEGAEEKSPLQVLMQKLYGYQLREAAYSISLFLASFVLAIFLTFYVYRDIVQPMAIIRNGLNNLAMGGDKKRINLRMQNEMGQIIESYNRLVDNMTSDMKRLVECPSCRSMYEMGDCFCKQCGRKLRFDG